VPQFERGQQWLMQRPQTAFLPVGIAGVLLLLIFSGVTAAVAAVAAWIALLRHFAQTDADRQRRITESFSKAVEQLAHDKIEVRLGGIYTLERISRESSADYWTVMETLTAFVRERARWKEPDKDATKCDNTAWLPSPTDIAAVLAVLVRRPEAERKREKSEQRQLDLRGTDLRGSNLGGVHLEWANLGNAHLGRANLAGAHLEGVDLVDAHLEDTRLTGAHLEWTNLARTIFKGAHLEGADLVDAHLEEANLEGAHLQWANLKGAILKDAHLEGADLDGATEASQEQLTSAFGNSATRLPEGISRPARWLEAGPIQT
jgi:hypothetical protein